MILEVTPRISPDGLVVMQIDAEKSALGPDDNGIPITSTSTGRVIRSPIIDTTIAQTTVSAMSGHTVVLGGLIDKNKTRRIARCRCWATCRCWGTCSATTADQDTRNELLIIMTPHIVRNERCRRRQAGRSGSHELVPVRRDRDLRRGRLAETNRRLVRRGSQGDLPGREASAGTVPQPRRRGGADSAAARCRAVNQRWRRSRPRRRRPRRRGSTPIAPTPEPTKSAAPNGGNTLPREPGAQMQYGQPLQQAQYTGHASPAGTGGVQPAVYQQPLPGPQEAAYPTSAQPAVYQRLASGETPPAYPTRASID